eukprot:m.161266 g.161266  ORF g.161266 m.161266 type:complete len:56 (+) comp16373_c7_seq6:194-361(+)
MWTTQTMEGKQSPEFVQQQEVAQFISSSPKKNISAISNCFRITYNAMDVARRSGG